MTRSLLSAAQTRAAGRARRESDVDRVVTFLAPTGGAPFHHSIAKCREQVSYAIEMIRDPHLGETAAKEREQLTRAERKLLSARAAIRDVWLLIDLTAAQRDLTFEQLDLAVAECRKRLASLPRGKRSGGKGGRLVAEQKRVAADKAFDLLLEHGHREPTLTKDGSYIRLAKLLFKVATGKSADPSRACAKHLADIRADVGTDAAEMRRRRRAGRTSPVPDHLPRR